MLGVFSRCSKRAEFEISAVRSFGWLIIVRCMMEEVVVNVWDLSVPHAGHRARRSKYISLLDSVLDRTLSKVLQPAIDDDMVR